MLTLTKYPVCAKSALNYMVVSYCWQWCYKVHIVGCLGCYSSLLLWFTRVSRNFPPTKFSTHCVTRSAYTCSNLDDWQHFEVLLWLFFATCAPLSVLNWYTGSPFSSCPVCEGWGSEQSKTKKKSRASTFHQAEEHKVASWQQTDQHMCHSRIGIVAILHYWPLNDGNFSCRDPTNQCR